MSNVTLYTNDLEDAKKLNADGIKSEVFKGANVSIDGNPNFSNYGFEKLYADVLAQELPIYLLNNVKFVIHEFNEIGDHYTEVNDSGTVVQEVHLSIYVRRIASNIFVFLRNNDRLHDLGLEKNDVSMGSTQYINSITDMMEDGQYVEEIKGIIAEINLDPYFKKGWLDLLNNYTVFHELMHAFLNRIYYSNPKDVPTSENQKAALQRYLQIVEQFEEIISTYIFENDLEKVGILKLTDVNVLAFKKLIQLQNLTPEQKEILFSNFYIGGIQEIWIRLLEARLYIVKENITSIKPLEEHELKFMSHYRTGKQIVWEVVKVYMADSILPPVEVLEALSLANPLTVDFIDTFIQTKIFPLMNSEYIQQVKSELIA